MNSMSIVVLVGCVCAAFTANAGKGSQSLEGEARKETTTNAPPKEAGKSCEQVLIPIDEAEAKIDAIFKTPAAGGRPLAPSDEPLPYRYIRARCGFVDKQFGFTTKRNFREFPRLSPVKRSSGLKLNLAERLFESEKNNLAQFPSGEIRWTEDGTNGLSIAESDIRIREAQIKCVKEAMRGREAANDAGTVWILNDDIVFGYGIDIMRTILKPGQASGLLVDNRQDGIRLANRRAPRSRFWRRRAVAPVHKSHHIRQGTEKKQSLRGSAIL